MNDAIEAVAVLILFSIAIWAVDSEAQAVTYCKNYETGEIIVVEAGMPCPYPTVQL